MKKITACIIISLVVCLSMAFPVSAAEFPEFNLTGTVAPTAMQRYYAYKGFNSSYPYRLLATNTGGQILVFCFKTDSPASHSPFIIYTFSSSSANPSVSAPYEYRSMAAKHLSYQYESGGSIEMKTINFNRVVVNHSTVQIPLFNAPLDVVPYYVLLNCGNNLELVDLLFCAENIVDTGYSSSTWQALRNQILKSLEITKDFLTPQLDIDNQVTALQSALDGLTLLPDITALQSLLNEAESIQDNNYTISSWNALQSAINSTKSLIATLDYTESQVSAAQSYIKSAINGLAVLPDITALTALIQQAESASSEDYTSKEWKTLQTALDSAKTLVSLPEYTASQVSSLQLKLQAAISRVVFLPEMFGDFSSFVSYILRVVAIVIPVCIGIIAIVFSVNFIPTLTRKFMAS